MLFVQLNLLTNLEYPSKVVCMCVSLREGKGERGRKEWERTVTLSDRSVLAFPTHPLPPCGSVRRRKHLSSTRNKTPLCHDATGRDLYTLAGTKAGTHTEINFSCPNSRDSHDLFDNKLSRSARLPRQFLLMEFSHSLLSKSSLLPNFPSHIVHCRCRL